MGIPLWKSLLFFFAIMMFSVKIFPSERQIGFYFSKSKLFSRARFYLEKQYHQDPTDMANTKRYLASLISYGEYKLFERIGKAILKEQPNNLVIHEMMARFYEDRHNYMEASRQWEKLYWQNPKDERIRGKLVSLYYLRKDLEGLVRVYVFVIESGNPGADIYYELAQIYALQGKTEKAEDVYLKLLSQLPAEEIAKLRLAELYDYIGESDKALSYYQKLVDNYPRDKKYAVKWSDRLVRSDKGDIEGILKGFIQKFLDHEEFLFLLAEHYVKRDRKTDAVDILEKVFQRNPEDLNTIISLGELYFELKMYENSGQMLERYHEETGGDYHSHHILGDVYAARGLKGKSRREYENALELIRE